MEFNATFIVAMFSFVVFIFIMNTIYYKPVLKIIEERKSLVDGNYEHAKQSGEKAEVLLVQTQQQLDEASKKARNVVTSAVDKTTAQSALATSDAQKNSRAKISKAKEKLSAQEQEIAAALDIKDLAKSVSNKIFGGAQ